MSKRFFYTDPLAAAWMAKHFGMRFGSQPIPSELPFCHDILNESKTKNGFAKYSIHPDSLPLLAPHDGDFVEFERWYWERKRGEDYAKDAPAHMICGWVRKQASPNKTGGDWLSMNNVGVGFDDNYLGSFEMPFKIIQRKGLPFMWPESEDANG